MANNTDNLLVKELQIDNTVYDVYDKGAYHGIVGNGPLIMKVNGTQKAIFTANQTGGTEFDITTAALGLSQALVFKGITTTDLTDGATTSPITMKDGTSLTPAVGNVVLTASTVTTLPNTEFVWADNKWNKLGDAKSYALHGAETSTPNNTSAGTASVTYSKSAAATGSAGAGTSASTSSTGSDSATSDTSSSGSVSGNATKTTAGSSHSHSISATQGATISFASGVLTITPTTSGATTVNIISAVGGTTGSESAHTHNYNAPAAHTHTYISLPSHAHAYTKPEAHTHAITLTNTTATGTATVGSHTHTQN